MNCCGNSNKSDGANSAESKSVCPVMGGQVDVNKAEEKGLVREYKGKKYYFCCDGCPEKFEKNPENYTKITTSGNKSDCC